MSRETQIVDEELIDEVFSNLSKALKDEKRLLKRFYEFCDEYEEFDYDESGINMDEAKDLLRKADKIRDLILSNIQEKLTYHFSNIKTQTSSKTFVAKVKADDEEYTMIVEVMQDSFNLEIM